jgi:hypothetical protein
MRKDHLYGWTILHDGMALGNLQYTGGIDGFFQVFSITPDSDFEKIVELCKDQQVQCELIYRNNKTGAEVNGTYFCGAPRVAHTFHLRDLRPHDPAQEWADPGEDTCDIPMNIVLVMLLFLDAYVVCAIRLTRNPVAGNDPENSWPTMFRQCSEVLAVMVTVSVVCIAWAMLHRKWHRRTR